MGPLLELIFKTLELPCLSVVVVLAAKLESVDKRLCYRVTTRLERDDARSEWELSMTTQPTSK